MATLLVHISDSHFKSPGDPLLDRAPKLTNAIIGEIDGSVKACVIAFTGDATDRGQEAGFSVARQFLKDLTDETQKRTGITPELLLIPGNHDLVTGDDTSLRDAAIQTLNSDAAVRRSKKAVEDAILAPLDRYFVFAGETAPAGSHSRDHPYYVAIDKVLDGVRIRFHLINSAWMCSKTQGSGSLVFPLSEIVAPAADPAPDYEITLLHHPFGWFRQPE